MTPAGTLLRICCRTNCNVLASNFHTSHIQYMDRGWRMRKGLPLNPNACGPLTDQVDYTFKDGRPTPYGTRQRSRIMLQREYAARIVKLVGEIDYAVERHARLQRQEQERRQKILDSKLKRKGNMLLQE